MDVASKKSARPRVENDPDTTWVFDLDNTLYPEECDLFALIDLKMGEFISNLFQVDRVEARRIQKDYFVRYGTTLQGLIRQHNVDPDEFLNFVHDIDLDRVKKCDRLIGHLDKLEGKKYVFTNGDVPYATRVLDRLGVSSHMDGIFDIAQSSYVPKPDPAPYSTFIDAFGIDPGRAIMFEDMARNLVPASNLGMTTVWVRTRSEWATIDHQSRHIDFEAATLIDWFDTHLETAK